MDLRAIREHAQLLLHTDGLEGHGATLLGLVGNAEREHFEEVTALRLALDDLTDDEECRLDHHGYCQTHTLSKPCANATARALLTGPLRSEWMRLWDAASAAYLTWDSWDTDGQARWRRDEVSGAMAELGHALAEHKAKWAPA